jgi:DNA-binding beta-propeller fold protein YncE
MDTDQVTVYDGTTFGVIGNIPSSDGPHSVAYNPSNNQVYISNYWGGFVNAYDAQSFAYVETVTGVSEPAHIAVNPVSNKIYVANHRANGGITVIDGTTNNPRIILTALLDPYAVTVDTTRNLVYAAAIDEGRITIIDGATDQQISSMKIRRSNGDIVPLRVIGINPNVGPEGHLFLTTSSEDGGQNQFLLIPNGWPALGTPVQLDIASYPLDGITFDPDTNQVWVTSVGSNLVNVIQDGLPVCDDLPPFDTAPLEKGADTLHIEVSVP